MDAILVGSPQLEGDKSGQEERSVSAGTVLTWNHNVGKDWDMDDRLYARLWWVGIAKKMVHTFPSL